MAKETERKFLVEYHKLPLLSFDRSKYIDQFYLISSPEMVVRMRMQHDLDWLTTYCILTIKTNPVGITVDEIEFLCDRDEYDIKKQFAIGREISKRRFNIEHNGRIWELDIFQGELEGLIMAELECDDAADVTDFPEWVGREVTHDPRYKNAVLATSDEWKEDYYATDA